ncbi:hypothetical protein EJB05_01721, partial [Eragrostis curvula]
MATAGVKRPRERIKIAFTQDYEETRILGAGGFGAIASPARPWPSSASVIPTTKAAPSRRRSSGTHARACLSSSATTAWRATSLWQLLTGAHNMHQRRVVHRDIKPGNILLVGGDGNKRSVKICDLGLALFTKLPPPYSTQVGTVPYMAPEMLLGKTDYDERVDTWSHYVRYVLQNTCFVVVSLGCIMAEIILRRPLFESDDEEDNDDEEVGQLAAIFDVLGVPDGRTCRGFKSLPLAAEVITKLPKQRRRNRLRDMFPEETLPKEGFEVLRAASSPATLPSASRLPPLSSSPGSTTSKPFSLMPEKHEEVATMLPPAVHKRN